MKVSVIMPYKLDGAHRQNIFSWIVKRYTMLFPNFELILEEDKNKTFYKTKTVNIAASKATGDIFILADADIFFEPGIINDSVKLMKDKNLKWIMPYREYWPINTRMSNMILKCKPDSNIKVKLSDIKYISKDSPAGLIIINRDSFFEIGGYDERFKGWGCEDTAFYSTMAALLHKPVRLNEKIYHLWHRRERQKSTVDGTLEKNMKLRTRYLEVSVSKESLLNLIKEGKSNG